MTKSESAKDAFNSFVEVMKGVAKVTKSASSAAGDFNRAAESLGRQSAKTKEEIIAKVFDGSNDYKSEQIKNDTEMVMLPDEKLYTTVNSNYATQLPTEFRPSLNSSFRSSSADSKPELKQKPKPKQEQFKSGTKRRALKF